MRRAVLREPLREPNFRWFFCGEVVNTAGSSMATIALAFAVLALDHSATTLGWVVASSTVPMVGFMLLGGAVADRFPRALVLRGCNLVEGLAQGLAAILVLTGQATIWHLIALQFLSGCAVAISFPAFHGMVPILLPERERKSAYLLLGQAQGLLRVLGPAAAGVIVAVGSPGWALAVDAATYLIAAVFLSMLRLPGRDRAAEAPSVFADVRIGWGYARSLGWVLPIALCSLVYNALITGALAILGPVISLDTVGSQGWGFARAAQAFGIVGFAFLLMRMTMRRPLLACQVGFVSTALPMLALGLAPRMPILLVAFFVSGCGLALLDLAWGLTVQEKVPEEMLSRIMAIDGFFSFVAMPIGQLLVGPLAALFGTRGVELGAAALCVLTFSVGSTRRPVRRLTLRGPVPEAEAA